MKSPLEIIETILANARNPEVVKSLCADDVKYVSLNYKNPDLTRIMPWAGSHVGYMGIVQTFIDVNKFWSVDAFEPQASFTDGENVAIFGSFTLTSTKLKKTCTSPFAVFAKVKNGKVTYMQYMEDTLGTAATFKTGGAWKIQADPHGGEIEV